MAEIRISPLAPEELRRECDPLELKFDTTEQIQPLDGTAGQERALSSLDFGLDIRTDGYNLYVAGATGTGKRLSVKAHVERQAKTEKVPEDWCYVYNFDEPYRPKAISLSPGRAEEFADDMEEFIKASRREIPQAFDSENYERRKQESLQAIQKRREQVLEELRTTAQSLGFSIEMTPFGIATIPMVEGRPLSREEFENLSDEQKESLRQRSSQLQEAVNGNLARMRELEKEADERVKELDREVALFAVGHLLEALRNKYRLCEGHDGCKKILQFLDKVQEDIVEHIEDFRGREKQRQQMPGALAAISEEAQEASFDRYRVNVFVSNKAAEGAPVVLENHPTYYNLIGRTEYRARFGFMTTDHTLIRPGAVQKANGGYLVLDARDVLINPFSWDALKRALSSREVAIENIAELYGLVPTTTLRPEPIPLNIKVVLVGLPMIYYLLYHLDEDFRKLFKVRADFDIEMDRNDKHVEEYAAFIAAKVKSENLKHFDRTAVARIVDYGSRFIEDKDRLSARLIEIADLVTESSYWAEKEGADLVVAQHVEQAVEHKEYRSKMIEDKIQRLIEEGVIMIDSQGEVVGQTNALSIYSLGDYTFGRPSRITARTAFGRGGIIDIQRETEMSGRIHNKGVMILSGYLHGKYALDKPLTISATIAFEQLYEEVEGDSASSTELYTLLSSLADLPIKQGIAVTGSVNQKGEIQPIGGVNRKIEGFYAVCKALGLTGDQGVIIPVQNVRHLMLKEEVVQAVREGKFSIWPVKTIDEGIELLTGVPAGEMQPDGAYPERTVHFLVDQRLGRFAETAKEFGVPSLEARKEREKERPIPQSIKELRKS